MATLLPVTTTADKSVVLLPKLKSVLSVSPKIKNTSSLVSVWKPEKETDILYGPPGFILLISKRPPERAKALYTVPVGI